MSSESPKQPPSIKDVADEVARKIMEHIRENTEEEDARREAERDARVAEVLRKLGEEGKLPPRRG
jgi:alkylation response protein AidB-like acyl-CoA dehydrogenase